MTPASSSRSVLGQGALYLVASLAPPASALLITPVITEALTSTEYGRVANALVVMQVVGMLLALGAPSLITRETVIEGGEGVDAGRRLVLSIAFVLPAMLVAFIAVVAISHNIEQRVVAAGVAGAGIALISCVQALLRGMHRVGAFVTLAFAMALVGPVIGMSFVVTVSATAESYLAGLAVGFAAVALGSLALVRPLAGLVPSSSIRSYLGESMPMLPHQVAMYAATGLLVVVAGVALPLGSSGAGAMQIALLAGTPPLLVLTALNNAWAPRMYETPRAGRSTAVSNSAALIMWLMAAVAVAVALAAPLVVSILAPAWALNAGAASAAGIACSTALVAVVYLGNMHLLFGERKARSLWLTSPISLAAAVSAATFIGQGRPTVTLLAFGLPIFYLCQALLTRLLLHRKIDDPWSLRRCSAPMLTGIAGCLTASAVPPDRDLWLARVVLAVVIMALCAWMAVMARRASSERRAGEESALAMH